MKVLCPEPQPPWPWGGSHLWLDLVLEQVKQQSDRKERTELKEEANYFGKQTATGFLSPLWK
jgi:hypothetical protein